MKNKGHDIAYITGEAGFPPVSQADEDGLLAVGGALTTKRLTEAYSNGIFPWFNHDSLVMWWSPDPRMVLFPHELRISRSMRQVLNSGRFRLSHNQEFERVLAQCANLKRKGQPGTWITQGMQEAYLKLHKLGIASSYEAWHDDQLVGGLYGIDLGHIFCGESMFHTKSNASKFAFIGAVQDLKARGYKLIDCQVYTSHLESLGAREIPREQYLSFLQGDHKVGGEE